MPSVTTIVMAFSIFLVSFFACISPRFIPKTKRLRRVLLYLAIFTAGTQLATVFGDLIPHISGEEHGHGHKHGHVHTSVNSTKSAHCDSFWPSITAGAVFIALFAVDSLILHGHSHDHHHHDDSIGTCSASAISGSDTLFKTLCMLIALSIHSFLEGLAVTPNKIKYTYFISMLLHKILESLSVGMALVTSYLSFASKFVLISFYSLLTPIGILIADLVYSRSKSYMPWLNSLSFGSLLYVVCIETISNSISHGGDIPAKLAMLSFGYLIGAAGIKLAHA